MNTTMNLPGISLNETDGQVLLLSQPAMGRPAIDSAALHDLLVHEGYGECLLLDDAIASAASKCNVQQEPFGLLVAHRLDAKITVQVAPDGMTAFLSITPPQGGKAATVEEVKRVLAEAGVVFGVDEAALQLIGQMGSCNQQPVAQGMLAQ